MMDYLEKAKAWSQDPYFSDEFREEISELILKDAQDELKDRFYKDLEFGTGGLRSKVAAGSNRMNLYTVRRVTQGLANTIQSAGSENPSVAIAHDSRNFSKEFTAEAACVLAANGIKTYLFSDLAPTPLLSFAVRELKTSAGIVITASHNPPEYNGYKVYWNDGCQVVPPFDQEIVDKVNQIEDFREIKSLDFDQAKANGLIEIISESLVNKYYETVVNLQFYPSESKGLGVIYTALHGAGLKPVQDLFQRNYFHHFKVVAEQAIPDGNFPTVKLPNPEEPEAFKLAKKQASETDELILANDPDADRLGVMIRDKSRNWIKLNGNQIGQLLIQYILMHLKERGELNAEDYFITTIVTSDLSKKIANSFGLKTLETLTGFKYIGEKIREINDAQKGRVIFGMEESHGYLYGDYVRDKDGVSAALLFAEMMNYYKGQNLHLLDVLNQINQEHGFHFESLKTKTFEGFDGSQKMASIMEKFRRNPPKEIGSFKVLKKVDYLEQKTEFFSPEKIEENVDKLPKSNVISFLFVDGSKILVRPSGTEPKIKFYFNLSSQSEAENHEKYELFSTFIEGFLN